MKQLQRGPLSDARLLHEGVVFEDTIVPLAGHVYRNCTFRRCTMLVEGSCAVPTEISYCTFEGCVWRLNVIVPNAESWAEFLQTIGPLMQGSLPRSPLHEMN